MDEKLEQIKNLISKFANEASDKELSMLLEIAAFANTEYNQKLSSHVNDYSIQCVECIVCKTMVPAYKYCGNCGLPTGKSVKYRN